MRKIRLVVFFVVMAFRPVFASSVETFNGHEWRQLSENAKAAHMFGFMEGYMKGRWEGIWGKGGILEGLRWVDEEVCTDKKETVCARVRDVRTGKAKFTFNVTVIGFGKSNVYYVKELDAFYEAFPLCRGKPVSYMLDQLIGVWASPRFREITSYEEIGTDCGKGG